MTKKKYVLGNYKNVFDNMEDLSAELVKLIESGSDLRDMVIGTYVGVPEISTNIAVNVGGKVKRINKSTIKLEAKQRPPEKPVERSAEPLLENTEDDSFDVDENDGVCSFCGEKWVKKTVMDGFNTYLCVFHLKLESQLATMA